MPENERNSESSPAGALNERERDQLSRYSDLLLSWNHRQNLVGESDPQRLWDKHIIDGLLYAKAVDHPNSLVDIGSGNGLPGLVIAIVRPETHVVLLESMVKRCNFLEYVAKELELPNVAVVNDRAEHAGHEGAWREAFAVAVARRVAELPVLLEYSLPLLRVGGRAILAKGAGVETELANAQGVPELLGGEFRPELELPVPQASVDLGLPALRRYVVVEKTLFTPPAYPRLRGQASKRPLRGVSQ